MPVTSDLGKDVTWARARAFLREFNREPDMADDDNLINDELLADVPLVEGYKVLGSVALFQKLGQGGMGAVYKGKHVRLDVDVALKVMVPPAGLSSTLSKAYVQRFLREARTAAKIDHQNLVRVIDVNFEAGLYFLTMQFIDGESAADRLRRKGSLAESEAAQICHGAAEGLAAAHEAGIVHRDVKPDNIMIDKKGNVKVADLGLAKAFGEDEAEQSLLTQTQQAMGTPSYMAPEQFESARRAGPPADVWSLGVTLYQLFTGKLPWTETSIFALARKIQDDPLPDVKQHFPDISAGLDAIIARALEKDPAARYADCGQMARALREYRSQLATQETILADPAAGSDRAAALVSPPPRDTLSRISMTGAAAGPTQKAAAKPISDAAADRATPLTLPVSGIRRKSSLWIAAGLAAGLLIAAAALFVTLSGGDGARDLDAATIAKQAEQKRQADYENWMTIGHKQRISGEFKRAAEAYERAKALAPEGSTEATDQAANCLHEHFRQEASAAETAGNLKAAIGYLDQALSHRDDSQVRERRHGLERDFAVDGLLAQIKQLEEDKNWPVAEAKCNEALLQARGDRKAGVEAALTRIRKEIEKGKLARRVAADVKAGRWFAAWQGIEAARQAGVAEEHLAESLRKVAAALTPKPTLEGPLGIKLILVPGGTFNMGSAGGEAEEKPVHQVSLSSFYLGKFEVTKTQFQMLRKDNLEKPDAKAKPDLDPAAGMTWDEAVKFCEYLSSISSAGATYRLPTEAEWEYAARGSEGRTYPWGNEAIEPLPGNLAGSGDGFAAVAPVGRFAKGATPAGIHDLIGNVFEWCADRYGPYPNEAQTDPRGPASGRFRVIRGGAFTADNSWARAAARGARLPKASYIVGFRVVRELTKTETKFEGHAHEKR